MKLLDDRKGYEHILPNGIESRTKKMLIPDPEPFDKGKYIENQRAK